MRRPRTSPDCVKRLALGSERIPGYGKAGPIFMEMEADGKETYIRLPKKVALQVRYGGFTAVMRPDNDHLLIGIELACLVRRDFP